MRPIIFVSFFLLIFSSIGYLIYNRIVQAFPWTFIQSKGFLFLYVFILSSFLIGKIIESFSIGIFSETLIRIGSVSIGFFLYAFLFVLFYDFIRLINFFIPFYPNFITEDYQKTKFIIGVVTAIFILLIFAKGYINALYPRVKKLDFKIEKNIVLNKSINIVAVSDIHLGIMVNKNKTERLIKEINMQKPDIVIIAGDIIDDNIDVVKHYGLLHYFKNIKSKYGVYACLGNHEYISKANKYLECFERNGIHVLKDTSVIIDDKFCIIGRDDLSGKNVNGKERKSIDELTKGLNMNLPIILLDHQPYNLDETAKFKIDFQFSGHTHNGQIWPFNYITGLLFEEDWGYLKKKNTHFYISSGYGTSIMPIRVGNQSEILNISISGKD